MALGIVALVVVGGISMGCIDEDQVTEEMKALETKIALLEAKIQATEDEAAEQVYLDMIDELKDEIAELLAADELPTTYVIVKHTTTDFNESFSAWGQCGRGENHIKVKALERAEDFADDLSLDEDNTDIRVKYIGRDREYPTINNSAASNLLTTCYVTYNYEVRWTENEYEEQIVILGCV